MVTEGKPASDLGLWLWPALGLLAVGGSLLAVLPHLIAWARSGDWTYIPDGDGLLYLAWSRGVVLGGEDRLTDAIHSSSGPMMHPWLLFVPLGQFARRLGLDMSGLGVVWRLVSGGLMALGLFAAIRPTTRRAGVAIGLAVFLLFDSGMMFGQVLRREAEILVSLARGSRWFLTGVPRLMPHLRVVTTGLALPALLLHFAAVLQARLGGGTAWRALAIGSFGLLFYVYFYYWTMVLLGLALAVVCDRKGRWLYLMVLVGGLLLGAPALIEAMEAKRSTPIDWLWRTNKFVAIGRFEALLWPKGLILAWLTVAYWVFRKRSELIYLWCCTAAGLVCLNHQIFTGLQIENDHWSGAYGVTFSLLLAALAAPLIDRALDVSRGWHSAFVAVVATQVVIGFALRSLESTRSEETHVMERLYFRWKADPTFHEIPAGAVVAGDPESLFMAAGLSRILPLFCRLVEFSAGANDAELDERMLLNLYLQGVERGEARRMVKLPPGSLGWEAAATHSPYLAELQRKRRLGLIDLIWLDPRPWIERFDVSWVVLPVDFGSDHLAGLVHLEHSGRHFRSWRIVRHAPESQTQPKFGVIDERFGPGIGPLRRGFHRSGDPIEAGLRGEPGSSGTTLGTVQIMKIVIAEDDAVSRLVLRKALEVLNFDVTALADGVEAWEHLRSNEAQVVITDWMMPGLDGLDLCRRVRVRGTCSPYVYVIILTARHSREDRLKALQAGADDLLGKPLDRAELFARLNVARRIVNMEEQLRSRSVELERMHAELEQRNTLLAEIASRDGLTGLKNHRYFQEALETQFLASCRQGSPLSMVMLDVDQFKSFNDTYGHPAGDEVLCEISRILRSCVRDQDVVARYGGEEFAVLLPSANAEVSRHLAERLRTSIENYPWPLRPITISLGVSTMTPRIHRAAILIDQADRSLYQSKAEGRNRLTHARDLSHNLADRRGSLLSMSEAADDSPASLLLRPFSG